MLKILRVSASGSPTHASLPLLQAPGPTGSEAEYSFPVATHIEYTPAEHLH